VHLRLAWILWGRHEHPSIYLTHVHACNNLCAELVGNTASGSHDGEVMRIIYQLCRQCAAAHSNIAAAVKTSTAQGCTPAVTLPYILWCLDTVLPQAVIEIHHALVRQLTHRHLGYGEPPARLLCTRLVCFEPALPYQTKT
jgi:hypothetical protein